jgi:hypothetical protein
MDTRRELNMTQAGHQVTAWQPDVTCTYQYNNAPERLHLTTQYYQVGRYIATYVGVGEFKFREKLREGNKERREE